MGLISTLAESIFRAFNVDGVPSSGAYDPPKSDIVSLFEEIDSEIAGGIIGFATWAELQNVIPPGALDGYLAKVYDDAGTHIDPVTGGVSPTVHVPNQGVYRFHTASPTGWEWIANLEADDAKAWATQLGSEVDGVDWSSKEWAVGTDTRGVSGAGSAKDWANYTGGTVDGAEYSAKYYAQESTAILAGNFEVNVGLNHAVTTATQNNTIRATTTGTITSDNGFVLFDNQPIVSGQPITIAVPAGFILNPAFHTYTGLNGTGSHAYVSVGFTVSADGAVIYYTPSVTGYLSFMGKYAPGGVFTTGVACPTAAYNACVAGVMLSYATEPQVYQPQGGPAYIAIPAARTLPLLHTLSGGYSYVRFLFNATYDVMQRYLVGDLESASSNGILQSSASTLIAKATADADSYGTWIANFTPTPGTYSAALTNDELAPINIALTSGTRFLGGGHGNPAYKLTAASHGKTTADIGQKLSNSGITWQMVAYIDANTITVWAPDSSAAAVTGTYAYVSGGSNTSNVTATAVSSVQQLYPADQNLEVSTYQDFGAGWQKAGALSGNFGVARVMYGQKYDIPHPDDVEAFFTTNGASAAGNYNDPSVPSMCSCSESRIVSGSGATASLYMFTNNKAGQVYNWVGGAQWQGGSSRPPPSGGTSHFWVSRVGAITGLDGSGSPTGPTLDFTTEPDITSNAYTFNFNSAAWLNGAKPPCAAAFVLYNSSAARDWTYAMVLDPDFSTLTYRTCAGELSQNEKYYSCILGSPQFVVTPETLAAGVSLQALNAAGWFDNIANTDYLFRLTYWRPDGRGFAAQSLSALGIVWVPVDEQFMGWKVSQTTNLATYTDTGVTLLSSFVTEAGIRVNFASKGLLMALLSPPN